MNGSWCMVVTKQHINKFYVTKIKIIPRIRRFHHIQNGGINISISSFHCKSKFKERPKWVCFPLKEDIIMEKGRNKVRR